MPVLGFWDLLIIGFLVLIVFGPKRLPQMGKSMGGAIKGFKDSVTGRMDKLDAEHEKERAEQQAPQALPPAQPTPPAPPRPAHDPRERDTVL